MSCYIEQFVGYGLLINRLQAWLLCTGTARSHLGTILSLIYKF